MVAEGGKGIQAAVSSKEVLGKQRSDSLQQDVEAKRDAHAGFQDARSARDICVAECCVAIKIRQVRFAQA
jgi:hypothetical protein